MVKSNISILLLNTQKRTTKFCNTIMTPFRAFGSLCWKYLSLDPWLTKIRHDGKEQKIVFWLCLFAGILGVDYFYLKMKRQGWIRLVISWIGATMIILIWIIYASTFQFNSKLPNVAPVDQGINAIPLLDYYKIVLPISLVGTAILILVWLHTLYSSVLILLQKFIDGNQIKICDWNTTHEQYIANLVKGTV